MAGKKATKLNRDDLIEVVKNAPLVSIDLIIKNNRNQVLLGLRNNEPAKGFWFVPGGRILKNELICEAFERIAHEELGIKLAYKNSNFLGVFEHLYEENFAGQQGFGTHYVVLAYGIKITETQLKPLDEQHSQYRWFDEDSLRQAKMVHPYTKAYFTEKKVC
ncbi:MAG: GDP-mannose mannosyl hydrolase [Sedimentisphaerales bacterium]